MTVTAPRDGIVVYVTNWRNEKKKVGESCWMGEKVLEIPSLERMVAVGEVDEAQSGRVRTGQPATVRLDAHPDLEYRGVLAEISNAVRRRSPQNAEKVVELEIALEQTDPERMRPGMRLKGTVEVDRVADALTLPLTAVRATPDGPVAYRPTLTGPRPVPLELGPHNRRSVQVLGGLRAGDAVLATPPRDVEESG
jgi:multidrug resistance efflux pump